MENKETWKI